MKIHLVVIDPQNDFVLPTGNLAVAGADADMNRLSTMVDRIGDKFDDIWVTLDSHHINDLSHQNFWVNNKGEHPSPFTQISTKDVENDVWRPTIYGIKSRMLNYVQELEKSNKYQLMIWPDHCLIGSTGQAIYEPLFKSLCNWERKNIGLVNYLTKGSNIFTEHYSAVQAEIPDPSDASTQINTSFIQTLEDADIIALAGEASSHCLKFTAINIMENFADPKAIEKICLLTDATSAVTGFESQSDAFIAEMKAKGMKTSTTLEFLQ